MLKPSVILLIHSSPEEIRQIIELTQEINLANDVLVARELENARDLIASSDVIFLDVRIPGEAKRSLEKLRGEGVFEGKKLVLMAPSETDLSILRDMGIKADAYITEPLDIFQLASVMYQVKTISFFLATEQG